MIKPMAVLDSDFETQVLQAETPVLVDFWADWCAPCHMIAPMVEELALEYQGRVKVVKLDVDASPQTPATYNIRGIPTLLIFKGGKPVDQVVGAVPKSLLKKHLDAALASKS